MILPFQKNLGIVEQWNHGMMGRRFTQGPIASALPTPHYSSIPFALHGISTIFLRQQKSQQNAAVVRFINHCPARTKEEPEESSATEDPEDTETMELRIDADERGFDLKSINHRSKRIPLYVSIAVGLQ
jgi:hypothetical protein